MKTFLFSILLAALAWSCNNGNATEAPQAGEVTTIQWIDSVKTVGPIDEGQVVDIAFRFRNTGTKQLVIENVQASCGCTVAERPEAPIPPGKEGEIKASFNSKGRPGSNSKSLTVTANTGAEKIHTLHFTVEVKAAAPAAEKK